MTGVKITAYDVLPTAYDTAKARDLYHFIIKVEYRGIGKWAVVWMGSVLNRDGEWEWEPSPSNREDDFFERCRFTRTDALKRAREAVDELKVNGLTLAEWNAKFEQVS